jgi:addiction module RelB/DinJ family antitoxin
MAVQNDMRVTFRVDKDLKERSEDLFNRLGMNMSTALNVFLRKAVDEAAIPFTVGTTKKIGLGAGLSPESITKAFSDAVLDDITIKHRNGYPVARYDIASKQAYLEYADKTREYING